MQKDSSSIDANNTLSPFRMKSTYINPHPIDGRNLPSTPLLFWGCNFSLCIAHIMRQLSSHTHCMTQLRLPTSKLPINIRNKHTANPHSLPRCLQVTYIPRIESRALEPVE